MLRGALPCQLRLDALVFLLEMGDSAAEGLDDGFDEIKHFFLLHLGRFIQGLYRD
jgi:hypothetical protein